ncbi:hypothetical protein ACFPIF_13180 [Brevundimonas faecalis]|uniref:hypothetical protein n=1 Tax=Brevundimonas faecalis TaxID=947378 RepID=UPI003612EF3A
MKYMSKVAVAAFAAVSMIAAASAVSAQTVSPTGAVTVSGQLTQGLNGVSWFDTVCNTTFTGTADAAGFTLTGISSVKVSGPLSCDDGIQLPVRINALSSSQLSIEELVVDTRLGSCSGTDIRVPWNNANSSVTVPTTAIGFCRLAGTLTVSPATTIN